MSDVSTHSPSEEKAQLVAVELINQIYGLVRAAPLYEPNNATIRRLVDNLLGSVEGYVAQTGESLSLQLLADEFFVNGRLLRMDFTNWERSSSLASALARYDLSEIIFSSDVTREQVEAFTTDLCRSVRAGRSLMVPAGYGGVLSRRGSGSSQATLRVEPHQFALFLYGGLLDLTEALLAWNDSQRAPSLLPLRRAVQLVIDAHENLSGAFQILTLLKSPGSPVSKAWHRVNVALHVIGFTRYLGLDRHDTLQMGLSGVLGGLSEAEDPEEAIQDLCRFPGLGEAAMPLVLTLHDARAAHKGMAAGTPGHILAVAERYESYLAPRASGRAMTPFEALRRLSSEQDRGPDTRIMRMFVIWKSFFPLGSLVQLSDGRTGVVVAQPDEQSGKQRPSVLILRQGARPSELVHLKDHPGIQIVGTPSPTDLGLDLASVLSTGDARELPR